MATLEQHDTTAMSLQRLSVLKFNSKDCNESTKAFCARVQLETITNRVYPPEVIINSKKKMYQNWMKKLIKGVNLSNL